MKRVIIVLFILALLINISIAAQTDASATIECMYRYRYVCDTTAVTMATDGTAATGDSTKISTNHFLLYCGGTKSLFFSYDYMLSDSVFTANRNAGNPSYAGYTGNLGIPLRIYKNFAATTVEMWDKIGMEWFKMEENTPDFKWQIADERKDIEGYRVQKATCRFRGRNYEAWFAADVPVADGPWKFCGLPGLIFEVYDIPCQYHYRLTGIRKKNNTIKPLDVNCIDIKPKKFYATQRRFIENPMLYLSNLYSTPAKVIDPDGNPIDPETLSNEMKYDFQEKEF